MSRSQSDSYNLLPAWEHGIQERPAVTSEQLRQVKEPVVLASKFWQMQDERDAYKRKADALVWLNEQGREIERMRLNAHDEGQCDGHTNCASEAYMRLVAAMAQARAEMEVK